MNAPCSLLAWGLVCLLSLSPGPVPAAEQPYRLENEPELALDLTGLNGPDLAAELRSLMPAESTMGKGALRIREPDGRRHSIPFRYRIVLDQDVWHSVYERPPTGDIPGEKLAVVHSPDQPNRYLLWKNWRPDDITQEPELLLGSEAMVPFAGSDFWLADLGLEFLHWPEQELVTDLKIRMRKGRPCRILDSTNPASDAGGYLRVRSWIDTRTGQPILAEAYDAEGRQVGS